MCIDIGHYCSPGSAKTDRGSFCSATLSSPAPPFASKVPACYRHEAPRLVPAYFSKFLPDTLFYIVYSMPGDEAQALAAEELTHRGWYFHKELKGWIIAVPNTEPAQKTDRYASLAGACTCVDPLAIAEEDAPTRLRSRRGADAPGRPSLF